MTAVSNSVVHLTMRFGQTIISIGTGFIYQYERDYFIVTAWHNLTGRDPETLKPLSEYSAIPDNVVVSLAVNVLNFGVFRHPLTIPLRNENSSLFLTHKFGWPRVDVAVIPISLEDPYLIERHLSSGKTIESTQSINSLTPIDLESEICPIQKYFVPDGEVIQKWLSSVTVTEELFVPGYPYNVQDFYVQPVWKRATIASSMQNGWNREAKFLIDCASKKGMSGSPVLFFNPHGQIKVLGSKYQFDHVITILAGVYVGRLGVTKDHDPQVGTVWNQSVIDEIIQAKNFEKLPDEMEMPRRELLARMKPILARYTKEGVENIKNPEKPFRYYARQILMKEINGRASIDDALEVVLEAASGYDGPFAAD